MMTFKFKNPLTRQYQLEYAMYMMLSSYFRSTKCCSGRVEERLYLYYQELTDKKQQELEETVIDCINKSLLLALNVPNVERRDAQVRFIPYENGHLISFSGKGFHFNLKVTMISGEIVYKFVRRIKTS